MTLANWRVDALPISDHAGLWLAELSLSWPLIGRWWPRVTPGRVLVRYAGSRAHSDTRTCSSLLTPLKRHGLDHDTEAAGASEALKQNI